MNRLLIATALFAACAGCNTVSGFGKDLQSAGGVIAGTAQGVQRATSPPTGSPPAQEPTTTNPSELCAPDAQGQKPSGCPQAGLGKDVDAVGDVLAETAAGGHP